MKLLLVKPKESVERKTGQQEPTFKKTLNLRILEI